MSPAAAKTTSVSGRATLLAYREDGPVAEALGRVAGRAVPLPPTVLVLAAALPLLLAVVVEGDGASDGLVVAVVLWLVVLGGLSSGRPHRDRLRWAVPPVLRLAEYSGLLWIGAVAGGRALPAAFALLCAAAFRHYDLVYRLRYRGELPPEPIRLLSLGWDGRLLLAAVLLVLGLLPAGLFIVAGVLGVALVSESAAGWIAFGRTSRTGGIAYEDEEDEGQ